jgi:hypothetical protein
MSFPNQLRLNQATLAATTLSGAPGTVVNGNKLSVATVGRGTVIEAEIAVHIETGSLTVTPSWQGSKDGTNWGDLVGMNNPANVAISASATKRVCFTGLPPEMFIRLIATTAAATATANDTVAIKYHYVTADD